MRNSRKAVSIVQNDVINKKLPDEIFALIFSFTGPSGSQKYGDQYPFLSRVCRRWRTIVLHNSSFWTALYYNHCPDRRLLETKLHRSKTQSLDIFMTEDFNYIRFPRFLQHFQKFDFSRIRSLFLEIPDFVGLSNAVGWSDFSAPNLENLSFQAIEWLEDLDPCLQLLFKLISTSRLRYLRIPSSLLSFLHSQGIFQHLSHVEWLKLDQDSIRDFLSGNKDENDFPSALDILKSLEELPNLTILNYLSHHFGIHPLSDKVVTLPKLRMLSLDNLTDVYCSFEAPNIDYISIFFNGCGYSFDTGLLDNFNFSRTSNITIHTTSCPEGCSSFSSYFVACISGADNSTPVDCTSFAEFDRTGLAFGATLNNGCLELPARNSFHIIYKWDCGRKPNDVPIPVKLATALVELTLNTDIYHNNAPPDKHLRRFLADILRSAKTIGSLNILHSRVGLANICKLLEEEPGITPRLERLTYHGSRLVKVTGFLVHRLKKVQSARLKGSSQPLKVLRVINFSTLPSDQVREIEELGIELIQT